MLRNKLYAYVIGGGNGLPTGGGGVNAYALLSGEAVFGSLVMMFTISLEGRYEMCKQHIIL